MTNTRKGVRIAIIGGTGLEDILRSSMASKHWDELQLDTPFGPPSSPLTCGEVGGVEVVLLRRHGQGHRLPPGRVPYRANIHALKQLHCTHIVATGATGSLREHIAPGDLVICEQLIDKTEGRPRTFFDHVAVHVEFADPFCPVLRQWLLRAAGETDLNVHESGTYVCMEGPSFSTRGEAHMHRAWGADVVGMTALPEARLAREAEIAYALIALPTDYDCWRERSDEGPESLLQQIIGNLKRASSGAIELIKAALGDVGMLEQKPSPAHEALALAIWTDKAAVDPSEIERLGVIWGRYFTESKASPR